MNNGYFKVSTLRRSGCRTVRGLLLHCLCRTAIWFAIALPLYAQEGWRPEGLLSRQINDLVVGPSGTIYVATGSGMYARIDGQGLWVTDGRSYDFQRVVAEPNGVAFASGEFRIARSFNGRTWQHGNSDVRIIAIGADSAGNLFMSTPGAIYRSSDDGTNMSELQTTGLPANGLEITAFATMHSGELLAAVEGSEGGDLYISADNGVNWRRIYDGAQGMAISAIGTDPEGTIYLAVAGRATVLASITKGESWHDVDLGVDISTTPVSDFAFRGTEILIATIGKGVLHSRNGGSSWTQPNAGLPADLVVHTILVAADGTYYAGTNSGIYTHSALSSVAAGDRTSGPLLAAVAPNPVRGHIAITLGLDHPSHVTLRLLDVLGRTVAVEEMGGYEAGEHTLLWNPGHPGSGRYLLCIDTREGRVVRNIIIAR